MCEICEHLGLELKLKEQRADRLYNQATFIGSASDERQKRATTDPREQRASIEMREARMKLAAYKRAHETGRFESDWNDAAFQLHRP